MVDVSEIRRATSHPPVGDPVRHGHSLLVLLDANTDWDALAATFDTHLRQSGCTNGRRARSTRELCTMPADVTLARRFCTVDEREDERASAVGRFAFVARVCERRERSRDGDERCHHAWTWAAIIVEFSAAQGTGRSDQAAIASQIAIGAVIDGNPLLRLLDRDQDGRLTLRERQELSGLLAALDRDADGQVGADEMPMPIRFAVTLGPHVHELLATPAGAARAIAPRERRRSRQIGLRAWTRTTTATCREASFWARPSSSGSLTPTATGC